MSEKFWYKVARTIVKAGGLPFPITDGLIKFLQYVITEEQAEFLLIFKKPSLSMEQIKAKTDLDDATLDKMLNELMFNGIIVSGQSKSTGIMIYRLMGPFPGIFEYSLMRGETNEKSKRFAELADNLFAELSEQAQNNIESLSKVFKQAPALDRTLPVEKELDVGEEAVIPFEELEKYFEEYGEMENGIALIHCYCRHEKELLKDPCKLDAPKLNCFLLDKSAQFGIKYNFGKSISKEEALRLCREAEDYGLVHKVIHVNADPNRGLEAICNCCKCCCGIFQLYHRGIMPFHTVSSYLAKVNEDDCVGCGTCEQKCPIEAIDLVDAIANINEDICIGCGVCAHLCPEEAIHLERTGPRDVFVPMKKITS